MAKRRRHKYEMEIEDINLLPIMNLITLLIPFLLLSAQFIQIGVIFVEPPRMSAGGGGGGGSNDAKKKQKELRLTVTVTGDGFFVNYAPNGQVQSLCPEKDKTQPCVKATMESGRKVYDEKALQALIFERVWKPFHKNNTLDPEKSKNNEFQDWGKVTIMGNDDIPYEVIVKVLDATREFPPEAKGMVSGRLSCEFKKPVGEDDWVMTGNCMFPYVQIAM